MGRSKGHPLSLPGRRHSQARRSRAELPLTWACPARHPPHLPQVAAWVERLRGKNKPVRGKKSKYKHDQPAAHPGFLTTNSEERTEVVTGCLGSELLEDCLQLVCEVHALGLARGHYAPPELTENGSAIYTSYKKKKTSFQRLSASSLTRKLASVHLKQ